MDSPNRNAKITTGSQKLMAPVGATSKIASDPWPSCQKNTMEPKTAAMRDQVEQHGLERQEHRPEGADQQHDR